MVCISFLFISSLFDTSNMHTITKVCINSKAEHFLGGTYSNFIYIHRCVSSISYWHMHALHSLKVALLTTSQSLCFYLNSLIIQVVAGFMSQVLEKPVFFNPSHMVLTAGAIPAIEILSFCLADNGNAFLVPTPHSPG